MHYKLMIQCSPNQLNILSHYRCGNICFMSSVLSHNPFMSCLGGHDLMVQQPVDNIVILVRINLHALYLVLVSDLLSFLLSRQGQPTYSKCSRSSQQLPGFICTQLWLSLSALTCGWQGREGLLKLPEGQMGKGKTKMCHLMK